MSISITLPENARPHELLAAQFFFKQLADFAVAEMNERHDAENEEHERAAELAQPPHASVAAVEAVGAFNISPIGRALNLTAQESAEVAHAVTAALSPELQQLSDDQNADVSQDEAAAAAFGAAPTIGQLQAQAIIDNMVPAVPVPPPTITAAAAQVGIPAPPPTAPAGVQLDKHGLPWDKRIHSDGENKMNADGSWRKRRGLNDPALVARVEAELRAALAAPAVPAAPPVPQPPTLSVVPSSPFVPPPVPSVPPPAAASPSVPAAPAGSAPTTFPAFMQALGPHLASKRVTTEMVNEVLDAHEMPPGLPVLAARPDLIASVFAGVMQKAGL